jgi:hypothetical protein
MFESVDNLAPSKLVDVIGEAHAEQSRQTARKLTAIVALLWHRIYEFDVDPDPDHRTITGFQRTAAEVAAALTLSPREASTLVAHAENLALRLPKTAAVLADGRTDWRTVELVIERSELVGGAFIDALDEAFAARVSVWRSWSRRRVINAVDAMVYAADPDGARERRQAAEHHDRRIGVTPLPYGMARISGTVAAEAAAAFDARLSQMATAVCADDPRTITQRRADAVDALAAGDELACMCGGPGCPQRDRAPRPAGGTQVVINVVASQDTITGCSQQPGYLAGYGVIDADHVRELADNASQRMLDPTIDEAAALTYQPSAALERFVRCRDLTCRFPGCDVSAQYCDIDHTIPFNHDNPAAGGMTVASNLKCLCRQHHRLKTFGGGPDGWRERQLGDGTVIWTSPTDEVHRTTPGGADLFAGLRAPACQAPKPSHRNHSRDRAARITRVRKRNSAVRPLNKEHRRMIFARKHEIGARKFRNHLRRQLFLFKGAPSTSPFCTWVNEPEEPEELPPDWLPPPEPPTPDEPPF